MKDKDLISIIIPVYKVEKYLDKCLNSVVNQTYKNIEIILVDDGSPDNCPTICDEWAKKDDRIRVIHKENGGLSSARNAGIDVAKGEYLAFIDSDDSVEPEYVEELYTTLIENNVDLSICGISFIKEDGSIHKEIQAIEPTLFLNDDKYNLLLLHNTMVVVAWNKLYSKKIFESLRYPLGKIQEDEFVILDILKNAEKGVAINNKKLYNYLYRENSIMTSKSPKGIFHPVEAYKIRYEQIDKKEIKNDTGRKILQEYLEAYQKFYKNKEVAKEILKRYKEDYKIYKKCLTTLKRKIKYMIFRYVPRFFCIKK